jgi:SAM-dependent methyltransferase
VVRDPVFRPDRLQRLHEMEPTHFWFEGRRAIVDRLLTSAMPGGPRDVIDVGCGTGWLVERLVGQGHRVTGVDSRPEAIEAVRARCGDARAILADAASIPLPDGCADAVILLDVLEHVDDAAAIDEIRRLLRPGGLAIIGVPALPWLWSFRDEDAGHRRRYTRRSLRRVLQAGGLRPVGLRYFQFLLFPLVVLSRLIGRRTTRARDLEDRPPGIANWILGRVSLTDAVIGTHLEWPIGSSLVAVCRRA